MTNHVGKYHFVASALILGSQCILAGCRTTPQESHDATIPVTTVDNSEASGPPTTIWIYVEISHIKREVASLQVLAEREPHALLSHEVRAIHRCLSLNGVLSRALIPPPDSVVAAVGALVVVCQGLSKLEVGDEIRAADIAELAAAMAGLGELLWPT